MLRPSPDVICQHLDTETVLLDVPTGLYYSLDAVGGRMWRLLDEHGGDEALVLRDLVAEYEVDEGRARADLQALQARLQAAGLLR